MSTGPVPLEAAEFATAKPIWPRGREKETNLFVGFRAVIDMSEQVRVVLRVAASNVYRAYLNGQFCGYGPARGPHGYYRVDEWEVMGLFVPGRNVIALEVAGYNVHSYYLLDQPAFLLAEVLAAGKVVASTAGDGAAFESFILDERVQGSQRYSIQRTFTEVYRLDLDHGRWRKDAAAVVSKVEQAVFPPIRLLARGVPYPRFHLRAPAWHTAKGSIGSDYLGGYPEQAMKLGQDLISRVTLASGKRYQVGTDPGDKVDRPYEWSDTQALSASSYHLLDFGTNLTGFLGARVTCRKPTRLFLAFDEILTEGDVDFGRINCLNIVVYDMHVGTFEIESFEPYTLRYLKLVVLDGECVVENVYLREYANPDVWEASFSSSDESLNRLFAAGWETLRQNALDVLMDCPSRERAGWLCDSFFTARSAHGLSGNTAVESNFFENYLLSERLEGLPDGMLPMCYPANVLEPEGNFIPNWAMWFVLQLEEYLTRSGDKWTVKALEPKVRRLFDYFRPFENEDGLLEGLEGWVFIEWSKANDFVQDVSYPTNMLYAAALATAARMYDDPELAIKAESIRDAIRRQSFDGAFFRDNAAREDGRLVATRNRSEVCQYYAFFFDVADSQRYPELWQVLCEEFGPHRREKDEHPDVHVANYFVGNMLRMELLSRYGQGQQVVDETAELLLSMAEQTGTLWEHVDSRASCNQGFASHIVYSLYRDVLGVRRIDARSKLVDLRFPDLELTRCEGRIPTPDGAVCVRWRREGPRLLYNIQAPAGYTILVADQTTYALVRQPSPG